MFPVNNIQKIIDIWDGLTGKIRSTLRSLFLPDIKADIFSRVSATSYHLVVISSNVSLLQPSSVPTYFFLKGAYLGLYCLGKIGHYCETVASSRFSAGGGGSWKWRSKGGKEVLSDLGTRLISCLWVSNVRHVYGWEGQPTMRRPQARKHLASPLPLDLYSVSASISLCFLALFLIQYLLVYVTIFNSIFDCFCITFLKFKIYLSFVTLFNSKLSV